MAADSTMALPASLISMAAFLLENSLNSFAQDANKKRAGTFQTQQIAAEHAESATGSRGHGGQECRSGTGLAVRRHQPCRSFETLGNRESKKRCRCGSEENSTCEEASPLPKNPQPGYHPLTRGRVIRLLVELLNKQRLSDDVSFSFCSGQWQRSFSSLRIILLCRPKFLFIVSCCDSSVRGKRLSERPRSRWLEVPGQEAEFATARIARPGRR